MRFFLRLLLIVVFTLIAQLAVGAPWWSVGVAALLGALIVPGSGGSAFFSGFFAVGLTWSVWAFQIDRAAESILSTQVAGIFSLDGQPMLLLLVTGILGGLVAGFGGLSGWSLARLRRKKAPRRGYYRG